MEIELALEFVRVVEEAAIESARTMGRGDRHGADQAAVQAMRRVLDTVPVAATVVIGEGERDQAPMLYIGEKVGLKKEYSDTVPEIDIAVDPLEGTNLCALGAPGAITVLAASEHGGLLHAPDCYMEKIIVGPVAKGVVDLDAPARDNLKAIARRLERDVADIVVMVLDRPRHEKLVRDIREAGARIRLITDGDVSAAIATTKPETGIDLLLGIGGAPEGVLAAAALRCVGGDMQGRLKPRNEREIERAKKMGIMGKNRNEQPKIERLPCATYGLLSSGYPSHPSSWQLSWSEGQPGAIVAT